MKGERRTVEAKGHSDTGVVREENQDVFAVREDLDLAVLADGMGGTRAGGVAAEMAVDAALEHLSTVSKRGPLKPDDLGAAVRLANDRVIGMSGAVSAYRGMGSTLVIAWLGAESCIAHVGDSRAYRFRDGAFTPITKDHSLVQEWVDSGAISPEEALRAPNRNVITRAIGARPTVQPELTPVEMATDDLMLLCSDGLTGMLADDEIAALLADADEDLETTAAALVEAANKAGGKDNVTVVLVRC